MPDLPAKAIDDAAEALKARHAEIAGEVIPYDEPELRADLVAVLEAAAPHIARVAAHSALCWEQPDDGRLIACDRMQGHQGSHSWEAAELAAARVAELEQLAADILDHFHQGSDGARARVGQVQIAKWRTTLDGGDK